MNTYICVASGPSLCESDCQLVKSSNLPVIAVNSSWAMTPWCRHVYAGDHQWWQAHRSDLPDSIKKWCGTKTTSRLYGINYFDSPLNGGFNSGQRAILLARYLGAKRILLLGYDCSISRGRHWHSDHTDGLKNPDQLSVKRWHNEFSRINQLMPEGSIINCSRHTELCAFPLGMLEIELCRSIT